MNTTEQRTGDWFQTFTGVRFYPMDPRPDDVCIDDIAHALARICRYGGHTTEFYSVAQHSVIVSHLVPPPLAMVGLLHDATEAYIGDVVRPLKYALARYLEIEDALWAVIARRYNLPAVIPPEVKHADNVALITERRDLLAVQRQWGDWTKAYTPLPERIIPVSSIRAESLFSLRFEELLHG